MGIFWPLRNLWHNLHLFLDLKIEEEKNLKFRETVLTMWSQICGKLIYDSVSDIGWKNGAQKKHF